MNKEKLFYKTLQDIFIGAKVEGQGGFINLMKIKSKYYEKIEELLKKDIEEALKRYPSFRDELFDKLYSFFSRYFTESGSIYFKSTPFHNNVYEKIYTDDRDVVLFWKTRMLYYVKTDRIFRSMPVEFDDLKFYFDASGIENKKNNEKRSLIYKLKEIKEDKTIVFEVNYKEGNGTTKTDEILKEIKKKIKNIKEEDLERAFRIFEKQSEIDFFINKNAKAFLQEQFKLWSYQYFWEGGKEWTPDRVNQLQILKDIAFKIIDFVSQFEDELVKIWNKPKFVKNSNYVITLDRIALFGDKGIEIIRKLLTHKNIEKQIEEWKELGIIDDDFSVEDVIKENHLSDKYKFLPIDTKYFKDLELEILSLFDDLDNALDGWLIKSENYQALNTLLPKFKGRIKTIYIDPPYNTENDDFVYNDKFRHSSWLTMMENRLSLAKELMRDDGVIFVSIDDNELERLKIIMMQVYGEDKFLENFIWNKTSTPPSLSNISRKNVEYILTFTKQAIKKRFKGRPAEGNDAPLLNTGNPIRVLEFPPYTVRFNIPDGIYKKGKKKRVVLLDDVVVENGLNKNSFRLEFESKWTQETLDEEIKKGTIFLVKSEDFAIRYLRKDKEQEWITPDKYIDSIFLEKKAGVGTNEDASKELKDLNINFPSYPKPASLVHYLVRTNTESRDVILDFFAGSGTTAHAVMKLNKEDGGKRKFILVEMGDHFNTVIIPRIKKVAYSFNWKDGKPQDADGIGGFFKYYELEQYEETLANTVYENHDMFIVGDKTPYEQYVFMKDEKMLRALEIDYENRKVKVDLNKLYPNIDIAETISNLTGKWIKKIEEDQVEFEDGSKVNIKDLDYKLIKPLIWWE
jgi:adenine specific DNA methylase Mod